MAKPMRKYNWFYCGGARVKTFEAESMESKGRTVIICKTYEGEFYMRSFVILHLEPGDWVERED